MQEHGARTPISVRGNSEHFLVFLGVPPKNVTWKKEEETIIIPKVGTQIVNCNISRQCTHFTQTDILSGVRVVLRMFLRGLGMLESFFNGKQKSCGFPEFA